MPSEAKEAVKLTQADREAASRFARQAWHLFWPNDYERAMQDAADMVDGRCDNRLLVESFARHREEAEKRGADEITALLANRAAAVGDGK